VPLGPLLEEPVARFRAAAEAKRVRIELGTIEPAIVYGDSRLLSRVFENVLANSIQYNREGGRVKLDVTVEEASGEDWKAGQVEIRIADTGIGVPLEDRDRIFERFTRLDRARSRRTGGTGLGLAIAREIVGLFGGRIRVAESSAEGSVFEIILPGRRASAARDFSTVRLEV
jgi:signal transduction histidine kinase